MKCEAAEDDVSVGEGSHGTEAGEAAAGATDGGSAAAFPPGEPSDG